jgi:RNA polymerase sigma factor (sigma-70 family)
MRVEFVELVDRYHADLVRLAFAMSGDRALAEDAVQACWQAAWGSRLKVRDWERIRGWLFTVTANEVRRQLRRQRLAYVLRGRLRPPQPGDIDPRHLDLAHAVQGLSLRDRQLLAMRYSLGLTSEEIAGHLGLSASGTRVRLQRVLQRLRLELGDD